jgi:transcriptional regulator with XRE-family HTH domain
MEGIDKELHSVFGKVLRELRTQVGLTQEQLGFECDLDRTFISLLERGLRQPTLTTLFVIADQLNTPPSNIVKQVEEAYQAKLASKKH